MRANNPILDADLETALAWLRAGFAWWAAELRAMLPASAARRDPALRNHVRWRGPGDWQAVGKGGSTVLMEPAICLLRRLDLPRLPEADLRRLVMLDADRILPIEPSQLAIGVAPPNRAGEPATVAALPIAEARAMIEDLRLAGVQARRARLAPSSASSGSDVDFTPALIAAGLLPERVGAAGAWWSLAAFLFAANVALLVWRDVNELTQLETMVAGQQPAAAAARKIAARIAATQGQSLELVRRREKQDALAILGDVTRGLPSRAWVQRFAWDGTELRLSGYRREGADVIGALRKVARFGNVRQAGTEAMAEVPSGVPFDVTAATAAVAR